MDQERNTKKAGIEQIMAQKLTDYFVKNTTKEMQLLLKNFKRDFLNSQIIKDIAIENANPGKPSLTDAQRQLIRDKVDKQQPVNFQNLSQLKYLFHYQNLKLSVEQQNQYFISMQLPITVQLNDGKLEYSPDSKLTDLIENNYQDIEKIITDLKDKLVKDDYIPAGELRSKIKEQHDILNKLNEQKNFLSEYLKSLKEKANEIQQEQEKIDNQQIDDLIKLSNGKITQKRVISTLSGVLIGTLASVLAVTIALLISGTLFAGVHPAAIAVCAPFIALLFTATFALLEIPAFYAGHITTAGLEKLLIIDPIVKDFNEFLDNHSKNLQNMLAKEAQPDKVSEHNDSGDKEKAQNTDATHNKNNIEEQMTEYSNKFSEVTNKMHSELSNYTKKFRGAINELEAAIGNCKKNEMGSKSL